MVCSSLIISSQEFRMTSMRITSLIIFSLVLSGCEAIDCIVNNHPEFSKTNVRTATLNQVFEDTIMVSISNSYMDNDYWHTFEVEGELPPGISYESTVREITFSGTPTTLGDYPFRLSVFSEARSLNFDEDAPESLCSDTKSKDMIFSVIQGF